MTIDKWGRRHFFSLWALMIWLILCVPQNVVTLVMYYYQDFQESLDTTNYTLIYKCYDLDWDVMDLYRTRGIIIIVIASFGIVGNLCSILVLQSLATKSGFNRLLLGLGTFSSVATLLRFWFWLELICRLWFGLGLISGFGLGCVWVLAWVLVLV